MGTPYGFNAFYPKQLIRNSYDPPIEITEFQLFNKVSYLEDYIVYDKQQHPLLLLGHSNNSSALNLQHSVILRRRKTDMHLFWRVSTKSGTMGNSRKATYTNIPPGDYRFRIKASNNDGVWSEQDYTMDIVIKPPCGGTWSITLYILCIISGIIYLFYWLRKKISGKRREIY